MPPCFFVHQEQQQPRPREGQSDARYGCSSQTQLTTQEPKFCAMSTWLDTHLLWDDVFPVR